MYSNTFSLWNLDFACFTVFLLVLIIIDLHLSAVSIKNTRLITYITDNHHGQSKTGEKLLNRTFPSKGKDYYLLDFIRVIIGWLPHWQSPQVQILHLPPVFHSSGLDCDKVIYSSTMKFLNMIMMMGKYSVTQNWP